MKRTSKILLLLSAGLMLITSCNHLLYPQAKVRGTEYMWNWNNVLYYKSGNYWVPPSWYYGPRIPVNKPKYK